MEQKILAQSYAPAHISGIFIIDIKKEPSISGSMGCGICLEEGAITKVTIAEETIIQVNGSVVEAPTTRSAVKLLTDKHAFVDTQFDIPVGCGFGASGAGALSTALAINEALSLDKTVGDLAMAAHIAEVTNRTGLGDVTGQTFGGIVIRKKAGAPFIGNIDKIPCGDVWISWVSFGEIPTKSVLSDNMKKKSINRAGKLRFKELLRKPTLSNFFVQSSAFARDIEIMSSEVRDAIEAVEAAGGLASQAMLGNTVFAINDGDSLLEFGHVHKSRISHAGAHML